jgi:eukaryotic-like serine/threonine-protein kinase
MQRTLTVDTTAADPLVGTLLDGRYRVGRRIARGGMATVYEAVDVRLDRAVAIKVLHAPYADDPEFAIRFQREARAAAKLAHPNVVGVYDQGNDRGTLFLAMEYVPGRTLRELLREQAPLPPTRALDLLEPVLSALAAAHAAGFVHRDVKPENVLITDDGRVKVADFGLARAVSAANQSTPTSGVLIGTVSYLAPELVVDGVADARTDVYSCGVLLFEMLTGEKPHQGDSPIQVAYRHVHEDVPAPSSLVPGLPAYVDALVAGATSRLRETRFADAKVMLHQVHRVRHALERGVADDPDLTADLLPTVPFGEFAEVVGAMSFDVPDRLPIKSVDEVGAPFVDGDGREHTLQVVRSAPLGTGMPPTHEEKTRRGGQALVVFLLVLALAAAAGIGGWYYAIGRYSQTPDLVGLTVAQAERRLDGTGLSLSTTEGFSETVTRGRIISTDPGPGDRVLQAATVSAAVSKGKERYAMPDVVGLTRDVAATALANNHLAVGDIEREYFDDVAKGVVTEASEKVGARLPRDTEVDLVVSKGPKPIDVPDLVGADVDEARDVLEQLGLEAAVTERFDTEVPEGVVVSQEPVDGTLVRGDTVNLGVSKGPELASVPSVFGSDRDTAVATLEAAGFQVEVHEAPGYAGFDRVITQRPSPLSQAPTGSTVVIYVY